MWLIVDVDLSDYRLRTSWEYHTYLVGIGDEAIFLTQLKFKGAGKIYIENGEIVHITNDTGHLQTSVQGCYNQGGILQDSQLTSSNVSIDCTFSN